MHTRGLQVCLVGLYRTCCCCGTGLLDARSLPLAVGGALPTCSCAPPLCRTRWSTDLLEVTSLEVTSYFIAVPLPAAAAGMVAVWWLDNCVCKVERYLPLNSRGKKWLHQAASQRRVADVVELFGTGQACGCVRRRTGPGLATKGAAFLGCKRSCRDGVPPYTDQLTMSLAVCGGGDRVHRLAAAMARGIPLQGGHGRQRLAPRW